MSVEMREAGERVLMVYEWERVDEDGVEQCEDMHETLADARLCANVNFAEYRPTRIAKLTVDANGLLDCERFYPFRPSRPRDWIEAFAWGRRA